MKQVYKSYSSVVTVDKITRIHYTHLMTIYIKLLASFYKALLVITSSTLIMCLRTLTFRD